MNTPEKYNENTADLTVQKKYSDKVASLVSEKAAEKTRPLYVCVVTFGCQQNEADSERLMGQAVSMGYKKTESPENADLIIYNTCAVREHAELRTLSRTGALKQLKKNNPSLIIGLWGCMVTQEHRMNDIKMKYPYVDFVAGTNMLHRLPEILCDVMVNERRRYYVNDEPAVTVENVPVERSNDIKAYVSVMYGCNNFCTYCVVPHVRGRERSRNKECVLAEVRELVNAGYKDITLLGQNVNSYNPGNGYTFADLLSDICSIDGDFTVRFMTSHPKDASDKLISVMAENPKAARHFHLPMQSGSTEILQRMNRKYTAEQYLELAHKIKNAMPDIALTTDIIVGFPGETEEDFEKTLEIVKELEFDSIFAFIYSPRVGTPAAKMEDPFTYEQKTQRMSRLLELQTEISAKTNASFVGKNITALCDSRQKAQNGLYTARTSSNKLVFFSSDLCADNLYGKSINIKITRSTAAQLYGEQI